CATSTGSRTRPASYARGWYRKPQLPARDAAEDEAASRHAARAPAESLADHRDGVGISRLPPDVNVRVRLASFDAVADLRVQDDAGAVIDGVALLLATRAEADRRDADLIRGYRRHIRGSRRAQRLDPRRARQLRGIVHLGDIPALRCNELAKFREAAPVGERAIDARDCRLSVARLPATNQHLGARGQRELEEVRRALPAKRRDGLRDLEAVADRVSE